MNASSSESYTHGTLNLNGNGYNLNGKINGNGNGKNFDKRFFSIKEVSEITELEQHVLRYWESEFRHLRPQKLPSGRRIYQKTDIEKILQIKDLLHHQRFTIAGAKKVLTGEAHHEHDKISNEQHAPAPAPAAHDASASAAKTHLHDKIQQTQQELTLFAANSAAAEPAFQKLESIRKKLKELQAVVDTL